MMRRSEPIGEATHRVTRTDAELLQAAPYDPECADYERVDERDEAVALGPRLRGALRSLPSEQRRALQLRVVHGLPYEEVAGRLGCSQNAARLRVSRGLRALTLQLRGAEA